MNNQLLFHWWEIIYQFICNYNFCFNCVLSLNLLINLFNSLKVCVVSPLPRSPYLWSALSIHDPDPDTSPREVGCLVRAACALVFRNLGHLDLLYKGHTNPAGHFLGPAASPPPTLQSDVSWKGHLSKIPFGPVQENTWDLHSSQFS